jgi:hypothetical protein
MKLETYTKALAACLAGNKKVDCAYIMYTTESIAPTVKTSSDLILNETKGIARTKSIIISDVKEDSIQFTLTSHNAEILGELAFASNVKVYGIALVVSDESVGKDLILYYESLPKMLKVTEGTDIAVNVVINGGN